MNQQVSKRFMQILNSNAALVVYSGLLCFVLALLCVLLAQYTKYAAIWVVNAVLLIFIFRSEARLTKWYYLVGILVNTLVNALVGAPILIALAIAICNSLEVLIPILCVTRESNAQYYIKGFNHQTNMLVFSVPVGCMLSAFFSSLIIAQVWWDPFFFRMVFNWFAIDLLAMMAILPLGLSATSERIRKLMKAGKLLELIFMIFTAAAFTWLSTTYTEIRFVIILMPLLYAAFRLGIFGTAILFFVIVTVYIINIMVTENVNPRFVDMLQWISYSFVLMCITLLPAIIVSILIDQRDDFEQKLSEDEQRFRGAIQYSATGMALMLPDGKWMVVNPALCEITGYNEEELMRLNYRDITHPEDIDRDLELLQKLSKQEIPSYTLEKRYIKKDGEVAWISLVVSAVFDQKKKVIYYILQVENITMRKRMEDALQESEQRWNFALEGGSQGVWDWDITSNKIYYSRTWKMILGYQENEITSTLHEWMSRIHPDDEAAVTQDLNRHIAGSSHYFHCEHRIRCKDGQYKWFLGRGKVIARSSSGTGTRVIGTITDIDAIKKSEAETERLSRRLQMALDAGQIGIFNYDIINNTLIWDKRMYELYGTTPEKFSHHFEAWKKRIHPEDLPKTYQIFMRALEEIGTFDAEFRVVHENKSVHWIRAIAQVLGDNNKKAIAMLGMNWDITGEKQMVHDLFTEKERLSTTLKAIGDAVIVSDAAGIISFINPIAEQLIGCSAQTAVGKSLYDICKIVSETTGELIECPITACLKHKSTSNSKEEGILINHIDARYYIQDSASAIILPSGEIAGCVLVMQDVTMNRKLQTELKHQATHDVLTGLINRREIELKLKTLLSDTRTIKNINSLFFVDLDNFKIVNDTAGHAAGDELLRRISEMLMKSVRSTDTVARLGGDEFAILLPECNANNATNIANNIIKKISTYNFIWDNETYNIGASIGLVTFRTNDISLEEILSRADIACYTAKNQSGNKVSVFEGSDSDASKFLSEIQLGPKVVQSLQNNSFLIYAQKIVSLHDKDPSPPLYEILLRMQDDNGNLIMPGAFLKSAERQHMMIEIDEWVARQMLIERADEILACKNFIVSINLSTKSTNSLTFHKVLDEYLNLTKLDKTKLGFELTEAAFSNDPESAQAFLQLMNKHGCFISIDNFGKGLRSYQHFKKFEDVYIKLDGELIHGVDTNVTGYAIVDSVNQLAHKLGAKTIAQYVETDSLIHATKKLGIDYAQGYAIAKPRPLVDILKEINLKDTHKN